MLTREKYLDDDEVSLARHCAMGWAADDLAHHRRQGVIAWMAVDMLLVTGLRVGELVATRHGDFAFSLKLLRVATAKRRTKGPPDQMAITADLIRHVREFTAWKEATGMATADADPLFVGKRGPLTVRGAQYLWLSVMDRAGIARRPWPHSARHTCAVQLYRATKDLVMVRRHLRHARIASTTVYADVTHEETIAALSELYRKPNAKATRHQARPLPAAMRPRLGVEAHAG